MGQTSGLARIVTVATRAVLVAASVQPDVFVTKLDSNGEVAWSTYFGGPQTGNWFTYDVGASFDFYVLDRYGESALRDLFVAIGQNRDLGRSLREVLHATPDSVEAAWKKYLGQVPLSFEAPRISEFFPANGATDVPVDFKEAHVRVSVPMDVHSITFISDCPGLCDRDAYWKSPTLLAVRLPSKLRHGVTYRAHFGREDKQMHSNTDVPLAITEWEFTTR